MGELARFFEIHPNLQRAYSLTNGRWFILTNFHQNNIMINPHGEGEEDLAGHYPDPISQLVVNLLNVVTLQK